MKQVRAARKTREASTTAEGIDKEYYLIASEATLRQAAAQAMQIAQALQQQADETKAMAEQTKQERRAK